MDGRCVGLEAQKTKQEIKLDVILCGPLRETEKALLQRGDVEIRRGETFNLMAEMLNKVCDCDMIVVEAPYGQGLYSLTYTVERGKTCPAWMVSDPPSETVWKEINWQLDTRLARKKNPSSRLVKGSPRDEALILAADQQTRNDLTNWTRDACAGWGLFSEITAPEDTKAYLRDPPPRPPRLVILALPGVDGLNSAQELRALCPDTGLIWCCDLDFSLQAYRLEADYFFLMESLSREMLKTSLDRWKKHVEEKKNGGCYQ